MQKRIWMAMAFLALGVGAMAVIPAGGGYLQGPSPMPDRAAALVNPEMARVAAEGSAATFLADVRVGLGLGDPDLAFEVTGVEVDDLGASHVRYQETYRGLPVMGHQVIVHVNNGTGGVYSLANRAEAVPSMAVTPSLSERDARGAAKAAFVFDEGSGKADAEARLAIYPDCAGYHLAYVVRVSNVLRNSYEPAERVYIVDANTGDILETWNDLHTKGKPGGGGGATYTLPVTGTGKTLYSGNVNMGTAQASDGSSQFAMIDLGRGSMYTTNMNNRTSGSGTTFTATSNVWGNNTTSNAATVGADAHYGAEMTWDFYKQTYGRNGIYNDGKGSYSRVHYGRNYNNAFWSDSCKCMTYGDGDGRVLSPLTSLDVAGHEMSHGITAATSKLTYSGQSGGLNESFSDIMGTGVEYYAATHGASKNWNYLIGEDVYTPSTPNDALRYMDNPSKDGASIDNYSKYTSSLDVHYSSGIWNNMFYLLAHGGTNATSKISVTGIGIDKALAICYYANTNYFSNSETFAQARQDCIAAAIQLYGASSTEVTRVGQAWTAVGVN